MIDRGQGPSIVLIPGIQGRWEWMTPAVRALSAHARVLSFSLHEPEAGPDGAGTRPPGPDTFDAWVRFIDRRLDQAGVLRTTVVGISFGGLVAVRYAAHRPARVARLILASTPAPRWQPGRRQARYLRHPHLMLPAFAARGVASLLPETMAARPTWPSRLAFGLFCARRAIRYPVSPRRMARWVRAWMATDLEADCRLVTAPTLVVTGEPGLDRQVDVSGTEQYLALIPGARSVRLPHTGHIGLVSRPQAFAALVMGFVAETAQPPASEPSTASPAAEKAG